MKTQHENEDLLFSCEYVEKKRPGCFLQFTWPDENGIWHFGYYYGLDVMGRPVYFDDLVSRNLFHLTPFISSRAEQTGYYGIATDVPGSLPDEGVTVVQNWLYICPEKSSSQRLQYKIGDGLQAFLWIAKGQALKKPVYTWECPESGETWDVETGQIFKPLVS